MPTDAPSNLESTYLRLRNDATVETLSVDETFWEKISSGKLGSFHHEYLVTAYRFDADWKSWEMHPNGDEIVCLISGAVRFVLKTTQGEQITRLTNRVSSRSCRKARGTRRKWMHLRICFSSPRAKGLSIGIFKKAESKVMR